MTKKIQVRTVEMKANAEVIVLNSAFVARITKCLMHLEAFNSRIQTEFDRYHHDSDCIKTALCHGDIDDVAETRTLLQDIYDAFIGEEEKPEEKPEEKSEEKQ